MSDDDAKKPGGYRLEYASSGRAKCKGRKPCSGNIIPKGALRMGSQVEFRGNTTFAWRHWGCVTPQILANFKKSFESADELDGFEELKAVDKERVRKAWEEGKVADEDVPETAKRGSGEEEEDEEEPKKKKKRAPPKKKAKKDDEDDDDDDDEKPKKKAKKAPAKKAPAKKKAPKKKKDSDSEGEDFGEELDKVSDDEDDDGEAKAGEKRKRPVKKATDSKKAKKAAPKKSKKKAASDDDDDED